MGLVSVIAAGLAAWVFGAVWYMALSRPWMAVSGVPVRDGKPANASNPVPYPVSAVLMILMAGMLRHVLVTAGIDGVGKAALTGAGLGLFVASPWIAMGNLYAMRPIALTLIDAGYAVAGCTVAAMVLALF
jgi:hypothetical protein